MYEDYGVTSSIKSCLIDYNLLSIVTCEGGFVVCSLFYNCAAFMTGQRFIWNNGDLICGSQ